MNSNQLEYFIAAAELLNFTKAAERCHISQTAMTQQIRAIENTIGVPLFIRDSHHVELTAAGRVYLNEARVILERSYEAERLARLVSEGMEGELTIGFISGYGHSDLAPLLRSFHLAYPGIKINMIRDNMSVLLEKLAARECDLVFAVTPYERRIPDLLHMYIQSYPIMAVLPQGHPLASKKELTYAELRNEKFIMMQPANRPKDQMEESFLVFERGGYLPDIAAIEGDPETLLLMIAAEMGISLLPEYIIRPYKHSSMLRIIPMVRTDGMAESWDFEMTWSGQNMNPAVERFVAMMQGFTGDGQT